MSGWVVLAAGVLAYWFGPPRSRRWHLGGYEPLRQRKGPLQTNATFFHPATKPLHPAGHAHPWYWQSYARRAAIRDGAELAGYLVLYGLLKATALTVVLLAFGAVALLIAGVAQFILKVRGWHHRRHYVQPLEQTLTARIAPPSKVEVTRAGDVIRRVHLEWSPEIQITAQDQQAALEAVTTRLAIEAPKAEWNRLGRNRSGTFTPSPPPPSFADWGDIADAVARAGANDLVFGLGKPADGRPELIKASLSSDSPHIAISGGSGGGKSNLAAVLMLQELFGGAIVFNLDPKWISHLWLQGLPNVVNVHEIPHLHAALTWLGRELLRRTKVAHASAGGTGRIRANVGPRIIVNCEELNYGMDDLKDLWSEIRGKQDPKRSPALKALSGLSCAGRASDIHLQLMANMLTVKATGVSDSSVRGNAGIKCMARWDPNIWNTVVGRHIPMPPQPTIPGRIQLVTARGMQETQVPYLGLDLDGDEGGEKVRWARKYALSGKVAELPLGEGGLPPELWPPDAAVLGQQHLAINAGQDPETEEMSQGLPPHPVTIREGCGPSMLDCGLAAARKRIRRAGLQPIARDGSADLYDPADLRALREGKVKVPS